MEGRRQLHPHRHPLVTVPGGIAFGHGQPLETQVLRSPGGGVRGKEKRKDDGGEVWLSPSGNIFVSVSSSFACSVVVTGLRK